VRDLVPISVITAAGLVYRQDTLHIVVIQLNCLRCLFQASLFFLNLREFYLLFLPTAAFTFSLAQERID
jgi:hypothetical protein